MAGPRNIAIQIRELLKQGVRPIDVSKQFNCRLSTVNYHLNRLGMNIKIRPTYDWKEIAKFYDSGHTVAECIDKFGFCGASWCKAVKTGRLVTRERLPMPLEVLLAPGRVKTSRNTVKRRLLKEGLLEKKCSLCGITEWRGKPLAFNLDHADGNKFNWALENLRMVCPNCDSQQDTFAGKNVRRLRLQAESINSHVGQLEGQLPLKE